ncbi:MAG TPA: hypothetical protein VHG34_01710 [Nitrososphaeraceae archaeon]|nr:hypothetical protein [Nitrososphaeraceae archaeon]
MHDNLAESKYNNNNKDNSNAILNLERKINLATINIKSITESNMFVIPTNSTQSSCLQVIGVIPGQIITEKRIIPAKID